MIDLTENRLKAISAQSLEGMETIQKHAIRDLDTGWYERYRDALERIVRYPSDIRLTVLNEDTNEKEVIYVVDARTVPTASTKKLGFFVTTYMSAVGSLASYSPGDTVHLKSPATQKIQDLTILEKVAFNPRYIQGEPIDSVNNHVSTEDNFKTIASLRVMADYRAPVSVLDILNGASESPVSKGLVQKTRTSIALDIVTVDKIQNDIFRSPIDSQILMLGAPGTGKTTTLVQRLRHKMHIADTDEEKLTDTEKEEKELIQSSSTEFKSSWIAFTPTELLKQYLRDAINNNGIPANTQIHTWKDFSQELGRNSALAILRTPQGTGLFTLIPDDQATLTTRTRNYPKRWFEEFRDYRKKNLLQHYKEIYKRLSQIIKHSTIEGLDDLLEKIKPPRGVPELEEYLLRLHRRTADISNMVLISDRTLNVILGGFIQQSQAMRTLSDWMRDVFPDPKTKDGPTESTAIKNWVALLRQYSLNKFNNEFNISEASATSLKALPPGCIPDDSTAFKVGCIAEITECLREFEHPVDHYLKQSPRVYQRFRKEMTGQTGWYREEIKVKAREICQTELDLLVLSVMSDANELMASQIMKGQIDKELKPIQDLQKTMVFVDEATDFSSLQLAAMYSLCRQNIKSFFACGDFNQRLTAEGIKSLREIDWIVEGLKVYQVTTSYRQSNSLHAFGQKVLQIFSEEQENRSTPMAHAVYIEKPPVLGEDLKTLSSIAHWLAERICEVYETFEKDNYPTIAVFTPKEEQVEAVAHALENDPLLRERNIPVMACVHGIATGGATKVRVYAVRHIKGLEFEAVFFVNLDALTAEMMARYVYVGVTRAASFLGITCSKKLPDRLSSLRGEFEEKWN